jgi:hypothetical protein
MSDAPELPKVIFAEITYRNLAGIGGDWFTMKTDEEEIPYIRKNLHDAALACIPELEVERDAAYAEGYRAGVEDAANKIIASIRMLKNLGMTENAEAFVAAAEDIRALLNSEAEP